MIFCAACDQTDKRLTRAGDTLGLITAQRVLPLLPSDSAAKKNAAASRAATGLIQRSSKPTPPSHARAPAQTVVQAGMTTCKTELLSEGDASPSSAIDQVVRAFVVFGHL
jgi:hypothetical protein